MRQQTKPATWKDITAIAVGSLIALAGVAGLLLDRMEGPTAVTLGGMGLGVGFTSRFAAMVKAKLTGGKK